MKSILDKIFFRHNNLDYYSQNIKDLTLKTSAYKIFDVINSFNSDSEIRYVGGCIRKILNKEKVDDVDLSTNLEPTQVCEALKKANINFYETGKDHGTITAILDKYKFEITTLRKDIDTDGRHAKVKFSKDWKEDSSRRDFTINSIYADREGNLFDPYNGKKDLENGLIKFIGNADKRIKEDYLRILRYFRFFLSYSKQPHDEKILKILKVNIDGISKLSKERLFDELKKFIKLDILEQLNKDNLSLNFFLTIFPELKNINIFSKLNSYKKDILEKNDPIFLLSLMIIDDTDNVDYFLYKYNISKKNQKRIKIIHNFYKNNNNSKISIENDLNKIFYYKGIQSTLDIINFKIIKSKKFDKTFIDLIEKYKIRLTPEMPVNAAILMRKYKIPEGKQLGLKLKLIEEEWVDNNFNISDKQIENIVNN